MCVCIYIYIYTHCLNVNQILFQYTYIEEGSLFNYLKGIGRIYFNHFKAMYDPFLRGAQVKSTPYEWEGVGQCL